ncbi:hypothetical protein ABZX88_33710 [Kitasatospora aureofaciens]|uniref:RapZ C-terminal domain-containing protein n=1 Tax=Kitasatospora aureofaciens TaxID=1894 RepID=UPI0033BCAFB6
MAPETHAIPESCDRRLLRLEEVESPLVAQLAAAIGHLRTAGEHADPAASLAHYPGRTAADLKGWIGGNVQMIAELLVPLIAPHTRVEITSYGVLHQDPPLGDALTLDLTTALRNPPEDPEVREVMLHSSGLDQVVYDYVLATPGAVEIAERTVLRVLAQAAALPGQPVALHVYCRGGKHLDDPDHMEFPQNYDHTATRARFDQLADRLDQRFRCTCTVDRGVQDANHHGTIVIPTSETASGDHITITVSNYGNLVAVTLGNPGSYDKEEENVLFETADRRPIDDELDALGYTAVSEHLLWTRYDGVSNRGTCFEPRTWWDRFFDYI